MSRRPRDQLFKKSDIDRLIEIARRKNLPIARIDVTRDGLSLVVGQPTSNGPTQPLTGWDDVLKKKHDDQAA